MFKILRSPVLSRPIACFLIFSFTLTINGCYYFKVNRSAGKTSGTISKMQEEKKFIILHLDDKVWHFQDIIVNEESVEGTISVLNDHDRYLTVNPEIANRYKKGGKSDQKYVLNEVHIYVSGFAESGPGKISVPTNEIQKIEIYDKASGATTASWLLSSIGVGMGASALLLVIVLLTKSSCPFVYANNGNDFIFSGEIFSGATQPGLERDDYLYLPSIASAEGDYRLKLTNEVHEIQSVNFAELLVVDHSADLSVLIDKYGIVRTFSNPLKPVYAVNRSGKNILSVIGSKDTLNYSGDVNGNDKSGIENIILKFPKPQNCDSAKLVIRAKNSFWLDVLFTRFHKLFGGKYDQFASKQETAPGEELKKFLIDQNIPLSVFIEKDGEWQFKDYFNIAGPMALRDDILPIDLDGIHSDTIKIKLETGYLFWELDYAGIDFSRDESVNIATLSANNADTNCGTDAKDLINSIDNKYLVLKNIGDEALLTFYHQPYWDMKKSVFLHTSGYYKILREQKGPAKRKELLTFRNPNRFPQFSKEMYDLLHQK
jgi:hypothetical protein